MENESTEENPRKVLKYWAEEIKAKAVIISSISADLSRTASEYEDIADIAIGGAEHGSDHGEWENAIGNAIRLDENLSGVISSFQSFYRLSPSTNSSGSAVVSGIANLVSEQYYTSMESGQVSAAVKVNAKIADFFDRYSYRQRARDLIAKFGLADIAMEKFDAAWEAFLQAPQGLDISISALIPLRESIGLIVDELIRHRPTQRPVNKKGKIIEIGDQLHDDFVQLDFFDSPNEDLRDINNLLSGAKDKMFNRAVQEELLRKGTYFITTLLGALDPAKLR